MNCLLTLLFLFSAQGVLAAEVKLLGSARWSGEELVSKTRLGGVSGLVIKDQQVYFVSDDRGLVNEPRIYRFKIEKNHDVWKLSQGEVIFLKLPRTAKLKEVLDPESILELPQGNFLIASEGDNNKIPRVPPRIFEVTPDGKWQKDIELPALLIAEPTGQQKKGVSNNFAFEAMTLSLDKESIWFTTEKPLIQDSSVEDSIYRFRLFQYHLKTKKVQQFYFEAPPLDSKAEGILLAGGWTEMIQVGEKKFWFLERSLRLAGGKKLQYDCRLVEADFAKSSEISEVASLINQKNLVPATFSEVQRLESQGKNLGNCEGFAVGPASGDFKQTLWVITDNNFSKKEDTVLYFFGVKN